jgi:hypothetical protein
MPGALEKWDAIVEGIKASRPVAKEIGANQLGDEREDAVDQAGRI